MLQNALALAKAGDKADEAERRHALQREPRINPQPSSCLLLS